MAGGATRYERLAAECAVLRWQLLPPQLLCGALAAIVTHYAGTALSLGGLRIPVLLISFLVGTALGGRVCEAISPWYRKQAGALRNIRAEIAALSKRVANLYASFPTRPLGSQFKKHYDLNAKGIRELEHLLAMGMRNERREVWVAAFCRGQEVARVTATMGSRRRCRPSDDVSRWPARARELACSEIRQYHNHPGSYRRTSPSEQDRVSSRALEKLVDGSGIRLRSYLVFWNEIGEYRILEYDCRNLEQVVCVFDAAG